MTIRDWVRDVLPTLPVIQPDPSRWAWILEMRRTTLFPSFYRSVWFSAEVVS